MPAFRFFDPWSALDNTDQPLALAKVAKAAKAEPAAPETLAGLAGLAAAPADTAASAAPLAPPATIDRAPAMWGDDEEERAAIVEHDGAIPREWAEGFAQLDPDRPPRDAPLKRWQRFVDDVGLFLDSPFCAVAAALGWGPHDLFGCDRDRPFARLDQAGLLWLLNGAKLVMLTEDAATIELATGVRQVWRCRPTEPGRVLAWEVTP
jgi:hypothetical protein